MNIYRIYSFNRPGRLFNFGPMRVGAYSRWALITFPTFSKSEDINKTEEITSIFRFNKTKQSVKANMSKP